VAVYARHQLCPAVWTHSGGKDSFELLWVRARAADRDVIIGALYHPPSPTYETAALLNYIEGCFDAIASSYPAATVILAGDLNTLSDKELVARTSLVPIVNQPTRGANTLDRIYVSEPCYDCIKVVTSTVKSDHKAVVACSGTRRASQRKDKQLRVFRKRSPTQHALLLQYIADFKIELTDKEKVQDNFDHLYSVMLGLLNWFYPERTITVTSRDPAYVTADIKALLRRKNRLMRNGRVEEAGSVATRIGMIIRRRNSVKLRCVDMRSGSTEVWAKVRQLTKGQPSTSVVPAGVTADSLNQHYASISADTSYESPKRKASCLRPGAHILEIEVFKILDNLKPTATGLDLIPAWFLRLTAPVFSAPIAQLFNQSIDSAVVPTQWKKAFITPIPKVANPGVAADYRPISITPVLTRILEKHIVRRYIYPALYRPQLYSNLKPPMLLDFSDQFAFRPTGSTTAALITLLHTISQLLNTNDYVRVIALDFSKAFDTVKHAALFEKLSLLDIPDEVYNWIRDFFERHSHCTKLEGVESSFLDILASVFQGSAIGPASYVVTAADLRTVNNKNRLLKYADDTYLIVPAVTSLTVEEELSHIADWARANNLRLNLSKLLEMICVRKARKSSVKLPDLVPGITRVDCMKVLGVHINDRMTAGDHVTGTIAACARNTYALRILKAHGLVGQALHTVFNATVLAKLLYCSPAWSGFCLAKDRDQIDSFLRRCKRLGFCDADTPTIAELSEKQMMLYSTGLRPMTVMYCIRCCQIGLSITIT
jgi:hypothetical protein